MEWLTIFSHAQMPRRKKKIVTILIEDEQATEDGDSANIPEEESVNICEEEEFSRARRIF